MLVLQLLKLYHDCLLSLQNYMRSNRFTRFFQNHSENIIVFPAIDYSFFNTVPGQLLDEIKR